MNRTSLASLSLVLAVSTLAVAGTAPDAPVPDAPRLGELIMDGHDAGHILYADRCSEDAHADDAGRAKFIAAMRADKQSKLARALAAAEARFVRDKFHEIELGEWFRTYHLRDGCGERSISFSAPIYLLSKMSNIHERQTKYLVTIDDDIVKDRRTLRLRSITPLALRDR